VTCLPEDEVISSLIRLPPLKEGEVKEALKYECRDICPLPFGSGVIDYESVEQDESGRLAIFAIAAKNDTINMYLKLFKEVGVELAALESSAIAMRRAVNSSLATRSGVLLVDMGEKYSDIVTMNNGNVYFTPINVGGRESLTRAISVKIWGWICRR
jgi:type IV pilus assembly protein PilM